MLNNENQSSLVDETLKLSTTIINPNQYSVAVYCAASENLPDEYKQASTEVGKLLARSSISLKYGAGNCGLMFRVAKGMCLLKKFPQYYINNKGRMYG